MTTKTQYIVRSQDLDTGELTTETYGDRDIALRHYFGLTVFDNREYRIQKIEEREGQTVYTDLEDLPPRSRYNPNPNYEVWAR